MTVSKMLCNCTAIFFRESLHIGDPANKAAWSVHPSLPIRICALVLHPSTLEDSVAAPGELHRPWIDQNGRMLYRSGWRALFWSLTTFLRAFNTHDWCKWSSALACCFFPRAEIALPSHYIELMANAVLLLNKAYVFFHGHWCKE